MQLIFASNNNNKLEEVRRYLPQHAILSMKDINCLDDIDETGTTFEENAHIKAQYIYSRFGFSCFADDSGLVVDALNGEPGIRSARYAGEHNNVEANVNKLLANLHGIENRKAHFVTVICLLLNGKEYFFRGEIHGTILTERKGTEGFGYDPIFLPDGYTKTFAEMSIDDKNSVSHRALAIEKMITKLNELIFVEE
ncbi:MAG: RdgB/HAM1 family non-canonical purine NTP pyrophosphatase [Bacteroidetes bacterium]|nr:RdgB/HAM1 family non-canonical purine NTP pyrophosphatase [Bacteroidota bacterium]